MVNNNTMIRQISSKKTRFHDNSLYKLLSNQSKYSNDLLEQLNLLLHEQPELAEISHPTEGSYFHLVCRSTNQRENIAFRMIYALSNAGADPNITNGKGNTPLHEAIIRGFTANELDLIQALFRVGVDPRILNAERKSADAYIKNKPQLTALCKEYGKGIWSAIETSNIQETARLIKGFIKVDCKHNSNKSLLDKARDLDCAPIIHILADSQVTIEFVHSILACDWDRASLIYQYENEFLKINPFDSIHRLTSLRKCSKPLLEYCLDTHCSRPFEILFNSSVNKIDVNILCTDGLPFFFHCFDEIISDDQRKNILVNSDMYTKSSKGETFLFHLIHLYILNEKKEYLDTFVNIIYKNPLLIAQRNEHQQTVVEKIEFSTSIVTYNKLRPFYLGLMHILLLQLTNNSMIEKFIINSFGYDLLVFYRNKTLQMTKYVYNLLRSLKIQQGLSVSISNLFQAVADNDLLKLQNIIEMKSSISNAKDSLGRTCAHLAVLHQRYEILKFLGEKYNKIINARDNLNRTSYHYACIMNDKASIEILEQANALQITDCLNFYPSDYRLNYQLCFEEFHAENFSKHELQRKSLATSNFLKLASYPSFKKAIENESIDDIKVLNKELIRMGFHLKDFSPNSYLHDYLEGERYIPLLFFALEHRSIASIRCLIQLGLPITGQMYIYKSEIKPNSPWMSFPLRAQDLQCFDMLDIVSGLDDDIELKTAFQQTSVSIESFVKSEEENDSKSETVSERQSTLSLFKGNHWNQNLKSQTCVIA